MQERDEHNGCSGCYLITLERHRSEKKKKEVTEKRAGVVQLDGAKERWTIGNDKTSPVVLEMTAAA